MQSKAQITIRGLPHSDAVEDKVREKILSLEKYYPRIVSCKVVIDADHHGHHKGNLYKVHININVPDKQIVVSHDNPLDHSHEDIYVSIRDAFNAARRQLEDYARVQRGKVKKHQDSDRSME